jgi:hypothetical protein
MLRVNALRHFARPHTVWQLASRMGDQAVQYIDGELFEPRLKASIGTDRKPCALEEGAPALPEVTKRIEAEIAASDGEKEKPKPAAKAATAQALEPRGAYLARLREIIDFKAIQKAKLRVVFDPFWGAARGYSDTLLREAGVDVLVSCG